MQTNNNSKGLTTEELQQLHAKLAIEDRNETRGISCLINIITECNDGLHNAAKSTIIKV